MTRKTLRFSERIAAAPRNVWDVMLEQRTYREWTAEFAEGSYYEGSWEEGATMHFLAHGGSGMMAVIAASRPGEFLSIKHVGTIQNGEEDTDSEAVRQWAPAFENYTFVKHGTATEVVIDIDVTPEWEEFMNKAWPKALARLRRICEAG